MKNLAFLLIALLGTQSFASTLGNPDNDPIVRNLREQFKTGTLPTKEQLREGKTWLCNTYIAYKDYFTKDFAVPSYSFHLSGTLLMNQLIYSDRKGETFLLSSDKKSYASVDLSDTPDDKAIYDWAEYVRVTPDGNLIVERTRISNGEEGDVVSVSAADRIAFAYAICPKGMAKTPKKN